MDFKILIFVCIFFVTIDEVELGIGLFSDNFVVVCDVEYLFDFDLVWFFIYLVDGGFGLVVDNGGNDFSCWRRKKNCYWNLWLGYYFYFKMFKLLFF